MHQHNRSVTPASSNTTPNERVTNMVQTILGNEKIETSQSTSARWGMAALAIYEVERLLEQASFAQDPLC